MMQMNFSLRSSQGSVVVCPFGWLMRRAASVELLKSWCGVWRRQQLLQSALWSVTHRNHFYQGITPNFSAHDVMLVALIRRAHWCRDQSRAQVVKGCKRCDVGYAVQHLVYCSRVRHPFCDGFILPSVAGPGCASFGGSVPWPIPPWTRFEAPKGGKGGWGVILAWVRPISFPRETSSRY